MGLLEGKVALITGAGSRIGSPISTFDFADYERVLDVDGAWSAELA